MKNIEFLECSRQMPLMNLSIRSTIVTIGESKVFISPGSTLSDSQLNSHKGITDLVASNWLHTAGIPKASKHFPLAKIWGTKTGAKLRVNDWPYNESLQMIPLEGMPKVNEVVFYHKDSKSLIVTDLCFNIQNSTGFGAWLILNMFGTYKRLGISRFFIRFIEDKNKFKSSINQILQLNFENIVINHGDNVIGNGKEKLHSILLERKLI